MSRHEKIATARRKLPAVVAAAGVLVAVLSLLGLQAEAARTDHSRLSANGSTLAAPATNPAANTAARPKVSHSVEIKNYAFSPTSLTVAEGDTVTWTNLDTAPHTVTVTSGPVTFDSGNLQKGQSFSYTFGKAGTYAYYCAVHPDMKASVTVTGATTPPSSPPPTTGPPASASPTPSMSMPPPSSGCAGLDAAAHAFLQHFYAAHLEPSLGQQIGDILNVDQYVKTHTVLIENMIKPLVGGSDQALAVFLQHVYAAHLEASPNQQVSDIANLDQYVKTHTVLIENMIKPLVGSDLSSC
ncbi:cupredoxin domain-containing protein [Fodinicola acaciae]|uniref:cupredoxin domain-containing protein n=1 Tax=Fodinicola acaciae TaxID=2681555 RepID=UPI0013D6970F|nr:cupredoxin family copper-binding protein [Fodinicola acaciae]